MPEYHFTGAYPRVLVGLSQGVNALLLPYDRPAAPYGSTIEALPGDSLQTDDPYAHPELAEVEPSAPAEPVVPIALVADPKTPADPAPADMTAEGAPAPAEPTL